MTSTDHRKLPRRRGDELTTAIFEATLAELADSGYAGLTMERVAERARTGKASLYRRWPSRMELVLAAVYNTWPEPAEVVDTGTLRGDLLAMLRRSAEALAGPVGEAMRGLLGDVLSDRGRTVQLRQLSQERGRRTVEEIVRRAAERGEVEAPIPARRLEVGQAMIRQQFLFNGTPIPDEMIVEIVDDVLLPLLTK
ncbi:transcriptional regulator, TetR family [Saccharopolyspora kobensis]|uniref:Transcriptional regulator, TetR family n=1 Tax=Saccharopolyspora kobensis TaxID=146035 RepID=A0A1H6EED9_9PSEU|nr:TetR/AcrR family transcriptional regulator [Saccharopolyspora kobensis]SEG96160.1 transcriptional regulator, TetR family [Saccharopolyspora kobensis]SFD21773.1 transcriptional regulator, TetR family [Saccharopolyspora kobensis]